MKLLYFLLIILIIYYVGTKINVVHIDTLPISQQTELKSRSKIRSMIMDNHIKEKLDKKNRCENNFNMKMPDHKVVEKMTNLNDDGSVFGSNSSSSSKFTFKENELLKNADLYSANGKHTRDYKHDYFDLLSEPHLKLPEPHELYILLRSEYMDTEYNRNQYRFNITGQPTTSRYPNANTVIPDKRYVKQIRKDMMSWNNLFPKYYDVKKKLIEIVDIKLIFITETDFEFVIQGMVKIKYRGKFMHFRFEYYGQINRTDDFINGGTDTYTLQLSSLKPMSKSEFESQLDGKYLDEKSSFVTIDSQMKYVDKINKLHQKEMGL